MKINFTNEMNNLPTSCEIHFLYKRKGEHHLAESTKKVDELTEIVKNSKVTSLPIKRQTKKK